MCQFLVQFCFINELRTVTNLRETSTRSSEYNFTKSSEKKPGKRVIEQLFVTCGLGADDDVHLHRAHAQSGRMITSVAITDLQCQCRCIPRAERRTMSHNNNCSAQSACLLPPPLQLV